MFTPLFIVVEPGSAILPQRGDQASRRCRMPACVLREAEFCDRRMVMRVLTRPRWMVPALAGFGFLALMASVHSFAQSSQAPAQGSAFVIVERLTTTGPESIQQEYGKVSRDIVAKFGGRYIARSQQNTLLEGDGTVPCCMAIISFPSAEAAKSWFDSPENQDAAKIRRSGATFRIVSVQGLP
jgi:uncharacterized protein (DUF1330 family)